MIASAQPNPSPRSQRDFRRFSPFGVPKLDITVEVCLSAFQRNVMSIHRLDQSNPYALATGAPAVRRLHLLHDLYSPAGRRVLLDAGLQKGMKVADFGCGVGVVTRMLAEMVGPSGSVTGLDVNARQLTEAAAWCESGGVKNASFVTADACRTGLPRGSFDLVYCRFLLLHLPDPMGCLREMREVLRPGGIIVVEDGDLASAMSVPPTAIDAFADLFCRFGPTRGLDYSLARDLYHMVIGTGFTDVRVDIHQPASTHGETRAFLKLSLEEAGPTFVDAGIITSERLQETLNEMQDAIEDPGVLILAPRMSLVSGRNAMG
jgi:SAM-dependent methyltransferase